MSMVTVMVMATTTIVMINPCSFYERDGTMAAIICFHFTFDENVQENLWATKEIVGEREIGDWFIIMRMGTAIAIAVATV